MDGVLAVLDVCTLQSEPIFPKAGLAKRNAKSCLDSPPTTCCLFSEDDYQPEQNQSDEDNGREPFVALQPVAHNNNLMEL